MKSLHHNRALLVTVGIVTALMSASEGNAQNASSPNYALEESAFTAGAGSSVSASFANTSIVGEQFVGTASSTSYIVESIEPPITPLVAVDGFERPLAALVPDGEDPPQPKNPFKRGIILALKLHLLSGETSLTDTDVPPPQLVAVVRDDGVDVLSEITVIPAPGSADYLFRFSDKGDWIYNLPTGNLSEGNSYQMTIMVPDGRRFAAAFELK